MPKLILVDNISPYYYTNENGTDDNAVNTPNIGLNLLKQYIKKDSKYKWEIIIFDINYIILNVKFQNFYNEFVKLVLNETPDILGFTSRCDSLPFLLKIAYEVKNNLQIPIIFGGPKANQCAEDILNKFNYIDIIAIGEYENYIAELVDIIYEKKSLTYAKNIYYRDDKLNIIKLINAPTMNEYLDDSYFLDNTFFENLNYIILEGGRGCPFSCSFCSTSKFFQKKYRLKSFDRLFNEINYYSKCIKKKNKVYVHFVHDLLFLNKNSFIKFIEKYKENKSSFSWSCSLRLDVISDDILRSLKLINLKSIYFGIETGSPKMQKLINKNLDLSNIFNIIYLCEQLNINTTCSFIYGFPNESEQDLKMTLNTLFKLCAFLTNSVQLHMLAPHTNSDLYTDYFSNLKYDGFFNNTISKINFNESDKLLIENNLNIFSEYLYFDNSYVERSLCQYLSIFIEAVNFYSIAFFIIIQYYSIDLFDVWKDYLKYIKNNKIKITNFNESIIYKNIQKYLIYKINYIKEKTKKNNAKEVFLLENKTYQYYKKISKIQEQFVIIKKIKSKANLAYYMNKFKSYSLGIINSEIYTENNQITLLIFKRRNSNAIIETSIYNVDFETYKIIQEKNHIKKQYLINKTKNKQLLEKYLNRFEELTTLE